MAFAQNTHTETSTHSSSYIHYRKIVHTSNQQIKQWENGHLNISPAIWADFKENSNEGQEKHKSLWVFIILLLPKQWPTILQATRAWAHLMPIGSSSGHLLDCLSFHLFLRHAPPPFPPLPIHRLQWGLPYPCNMTLLLAIIPAWIADPGQTTGFLPKEFCNSGSLRSISPCLSRL